MEGNVILQLPLALFLYGGAMLLCLVERAVKVFRGRLILLSALIAVCASAYTLVMGASLNAVCAVLLVFLLVNMGVKE